MKVLKLNSPELIPERYSGIIIYPSGNKAYFKDGLLHRKNKPAIELINGTKQWHLNGEKHRIGGPAVSTPEGTEYWYQFGYLHRLDGPAVMVSDGTKIKSNWLQNYSVLGKSLTREQFEIFQYMWRETDKEKTEELMEIFVSLVKVK